jgi:hypothetical protein
MVSLVIIAKTFHGYDPSKSMFNIMGGDSRSFGGVLVFLEGRSIWTLCLGAFS